jgi:hypothetical protein
MGLGSTETFSLEEARRRAHEARQLLADEIDPLDARRAERAKQAAAARDRTFAAVAKEYFEAHEAGWVPKHRAGFPGSMKHAVARDALPVSAIDEALALSVLQPIWSAKTVTASRLQQRIAGVLDFAKAAGYRSGENPARWKGHLQHLLAAPERTAKNMGY